MIGLFACGGSQKTPINNQEGDKVYEYLQAFSQGDNTHPMTDIYNYGSQFKTGASTGFNLKRFEQRGDYDTPYYYYVVEAYYNDDAFSYGGNTENIGIKVSYLFTDENAKEYNAIKDTSWAVQFNFNTISGYNVGINTCEITLDDSKCVDSVSFSGTFHIGAGTDEEFKSELTKGIKDAINYYREYCEAHSFNLPL